MSEQKEHYKLFVGRVPYECTTEEFNSLFCNMDGFKECELVFSNNNQYNKGFGFVTFDSKDNDCVNELLSNGLKCNDNVLRFSEYRDMNLDRERSYKVFVRELESEDKQFLHDMFAGFGKVLSVTFNKSRVNGEFTGSANVVLESHDMLLKVLGDRDFTSKNHVYPFKRRTNNYGGRFNGRDYYNSRNRHFVPRNNYHHHAYNRRYNGGARHRTNMDKNNE